MKSIFPLLGLLVLSGCSTADKSEAPQTTSGPIFGWSDRATIKPFISLMIDWQLSRPIKEVLNVPLRSRTVGSGNNQTVINRTHVRAPSFLEWRFAKAGLRTRLAERFWMNLYADASLNTLYVFDIPTSKDNEHEVYYGVNYQPIVIPGAKLELEYLVWDELFLQMGGGFRLFEAVIERGKLSDADSRNYQKRRYDTIADISETSLYGGIGYRIKDEKSVPVILSLRAGLNFSDFDVPRGDLKIERVEPAPFGGLSIEFRF